MKTIAIAGGLLASAVLMTGCGLASVVGPRGEEEASYEVADKVATLRLDTRSGDAVVTETGGSVIRVVEKHRWTGDDQPKAEHKVEGDVLSLSYKCPSNWGQCAVDYRVEIPRELAVELDSGSGNLTLRGLTGDLKVFVGSGDVDASDLGGKNVVAEAGSGDIELKYAAAPHSVKVEAGSGNVTVKVPDRSYDVSTDVGSGDVAVSVKRDNSSPHKISLATGSGNIKVEAG